MRSLRHHGGKEYLHHEVGFNFRMDPLQAAFLLQQLPKLAGLQTARREAADHYGSLFEAAELDGQAVPPADAPGHVFHQYVIQADDRDGRKAHLDGAEIGSAIYYPIPLHLQPCFAALGGAKGDLPVCEEWAGRVLALPIHPGVTSSQREEVVAAVAAFYS